MPQINVAGANRAVPEVSPTTGSIGRADTTPDLSGVFGVLSAGIDASQARSAAKAKAAEDAVKSGAAAVFTELEADVQLNKSADATVTKALGASRAELANDPAALQEYDTAVQAYNDLAGDKGARFRILRTLAKRRAVRNLEGAYADNIHAIGQTFDIETDITEERAKRAEQAQEKLRADVDDALTKRYGADKLLSWDASKRQEVYEREIAAPAREAQRMEQISKKQAFSDVQGAREFIRAGGPVWLAQAGAVAAGTLRQNQADPAARAQSMEAAKLAWSQDFRVKAGTLFFVPEVQAIHAQGLAQFDSLGKIDPAKLTLEQLDAENALAVSTTMQRLFNDPQLGATAKTAMVMTKTLGSYFTNDMLTASGSTSFATVGKSLERFVKGQQAGDVVPTDNVYADKPADKSTQQWHKEHVNSVRQSLQSADLNSATQADLGTVVTMTRDFLTSQVAGDAGNEQRLDEWLAVAATPRFAEAVQKLAASGAPVQMSAQESNVLSTHHTRLLNAASGELQKLRAEGKPVPKFVVTEEGSVVAQGDAGSFIRGTFLSRVNALLSTVSTLSGTPGARKAQGQAFADTLNNLAGE